MEKIQSVSNVLYTAYMLTLFTLFTLLTLFKMLILFKLLYTALTVALNIFGRDYFLSLVFMGR